MRIAAALLFVMPLSPILVAQESSHRLVCDKPVFDFGTRDQGVTFSGSFSLRNPGRDAVVINKVDFQCGCADGKPDRLAIPAGESVSLNFRFATRDFEGGIRKRVIVGWQRDLGRSLELWIQGTVDPFWTVEPRVISFGGLQPGEVVQREVTVRVRKGLELSPKFRAPSPMVSVGVDETGAPQLYRARINIIVPSDAKPRPVAALVEIRCDDKIKPKFNVVITGQIEGDLKVSPRQVVFGRVAHGSRVKRKVVLESRSGQPFMLMEARTDQKVQVEVDEGREAVKHEITVVLEPGLPTGSFSGGFLLLTDHPEEPRIRIEYRGRIRAQ